LGPFAQDSDLRRHGLKIAERGGKNAKKRAVVAVARKLSILLHHLWVTGEVYEPLHNARRLRRAGGLERIREDQQRSLSSDRRREEVMILARRP
jgi:hypothetical protein